MIRKEGRSDLLKIVIMAFLVLSSINGASAKEKDTTWKSLQKEFSNPSKEYRSAPLWVWNSKVTHSEIDRMLLELHEAGFGGAFVHPRPGLITEYMSDEWYELFKYSVEVGKRLNLDIWIYDENSYPSGYAGGHVPATMPESYNQGQGLSMTACEILPENVSEFFICQKKENNGYTDITQHINDYKGKKGEYILWKKTYYGRSGWMAGYSYVDLLYKGVTEKFLELTMSGYERVLGADLGPIVKGVFSDEPQINSSGGVRWTPDLFVEFRKRWGYSLEENLPLLIREENNWKEVRHHYFETLLQMFIDRWAKPMHDYCEQKGLIWTGHYWEHKWPDLSSGPDNMAMYAWHQMPAVDMLFNQFDEVSPTAQFGNVRAIKELRSVANQMGRERTLSETYGGGGWDVTFEDLKRLGDWEYVLGVNFMNQHLSHMTLTGARKYDYPPVFTYHSTWWSYYKTQNDYFARLSYILSKGEQLNDVLVLEPTTSLWCYYSAHKSNPRLDQIGKGFQAFVTQLEKLQIEYDLGCENIIRDRGSVEGKEFIVGQRKYQKVVLPPFMDNIESKTFELLRNFVKEGGELIAYSTPTLLDGSENENLNKFFTNNSQITYAEVKNTDNTYKLLSSDVISFSNISGEGLYHQRRQFKEGEILFLVNSSLEQEAKANITINGRSLVEMDAFSGTHYAYPATYSGKKVTTQVILPPAGSLLLYVSGEKQKLLPRKQITDTREVVPTTPVEVKRLKENALFIDFCDLDIAGKSYANMHTAEAEQRYYKAIGEPYNPWRASIQFKNQTVEREKKDGHATVTYHINIAKGVDYSLFKLVVEQPQLWKVIVNGIPVNATQGEWWLDKSFGVYHAGKALREGENKVVLDISPTSIFAEIQPIYLTGDFHLSPAAQGWLVERPEHSLTLGSWKQQGLPFYSWDIAYSQHFNISDPKATYEIQLTDWDGTVSEVFVNGESTGIIAYQPYKLDVSKWIRKGDNQIEVRVIGSHRSLLGPHHNKTAQGISGPWHWQKVSGEMPAGEQYILPDYGMNQPFVLRSGE